MSRIRSKTWPPKLVALAFYEEEDLHGVDGISDVVICIGHLFAGDESLGMNRRVGICKFHWQHSSTSPAVHNQKMTGVTTGARVR